ncbi:MULTISPECIES: Fur family transcriptional regulator [unclassified Coleofasciculus]|uniref:Fur family transcriptional regulator n=1 Tax=unclassified Coleofasciculus TaxID=2692782 RepID=UPI00187FD270|nr:MULTISPECIES: Fur family transcriptional regulator [unclassified Coleofasciculus]MBE9129825.1 transcriptional repressor [Coleofasciculus sp. LEGE 07081]MBE9149138.1 transcriptional repressor [Coleofasciculus sp. LEGE 07092]
MKLQRTRSQERILNLLKTVNRSLSAQDIYVELRNRDQNMGLATVYRSLDALKLDGMVQVRTLATGESLYSSVLRDQHHLTCLNCRQSIPIEKCPVHQLETELQDTHQFKIYYHTLEFFGLCDRCAAAEAEEKDTAKA